MKCAGVLTEISLVDGEKGESELHLKQSCAALLFINLNKNQIFTFLEQVIVSIILYT